MVPSSGRSASTCPRRSSGPWADSASGSAPAPSGPTARWSGSFPQNTCALIKSAMGFKLGKVCPYAEACDLVVGETTCDGKKKTYELLAEMAPVHVMELPQMKRPGDRAFWRDGDRAAGREARRGERTRVTAENLRAAIMEVNDKRRALQRLNATRSGAPVPISGKDALARRAGRLLRRRTPLHHDGQPDRRRARGPRGGGQGRGAGGRAAPPGHGHAHVHPQLEAARRHREGGRRSGRRGDVHRLALLFEAGGRNRDRPGRNDRRHRRQVPRHQLRLLHAQLGAHGRRDPPGQGLQGRRHRPMQPAVLHALPDRGDPR